MRGRRLVGRYLGEATVVAKTVVANIVIANIVIANIKDLCFSSQVGFIIPAAFCRQAAGVLVAAPCDKHETKPCQTMSFSRFRPATHAFRYRQVQARILSTPILNIVLP